MKYDIVCEGVRKGYNTGGGYIEVLRSIDLMVRSGTTVTIIGPSGSGKTTLLNIIATIEMPDDGKVIVRGVDTGQQGREELSELRNRSIGIVFQNDIFIGSLPLIENVLLPLTNRKEMSQELKMEIEERAKNLLSDLGLGERLLSMPSQLSGGEARRASLVRAIITDPDILLLDEPTASVDRENKARVLKLIESAGDKTILITTHDPDLIEIADEAYSMDYGVLSPVP